MPWKKPVANAAARSVDIPHGVIAAAAPNADHIVLPGRVARVALARQ